MVIGQQGEKAAADGATELQNNRVTKQQIDRAAEQQSDRVAAVQQDVGWQQ